MSFKIPERRFSFQSCKYRFHQY